MESLPKTVKNNGAHEGQRSIEDASFTNNISSTPVDRQSEITADSVLDLLSDSDSEYSVVEIIVSLAMLDVDVAELREMRNHSLDRTKQGRTKITAHRNAVAKARKSVEQGTDTLRTGSGRCNELNRNIGFLSLPGEIRNKIMDSALVPGHIYLSRKMQPVDCKGLPVFTPGSQVLATCKQLYQEGHISFYSRNMFHLAPGPLSASWDYFGKLNRRHQDLVCRVSIEMSFMDLTPPVLEEIQEVFYEHHGRSIAHAGENTVIRYVMNSLKDLWAEKIAGVCDFDTVRLVHMHSVKHRGHPNRVSPWRTLHLEGVGINKLLSSVKLAKNRERWGLDWPYDICQARNGWDCVLYFFFKAMIANTMDIIFKVLRSETSEGHCGCWFRLGRWMSELNSSLVDEGSKVNGGKYSWCEKSGWVDEDPTKNEGKYPWYEKFGWVDDTDSEDSEEF